MISTFFSKPIFTGNIKESMKKKIRRQLTRREVAE